MGHVNLLKAKRGDLYQDNREQVWDYRHQEHRHGYGAEHVLYLGSLPGIFTDAGLMIHFLVSDIKLMRRLDADT